jgi:hypothetical protein
MGTGEVELLPFGTRFQLKRSKEWTDLHVRLPVPGSRSFPSDASSSRS